MKGIILFFICLFFFNASGFFMGKSPDWNSLKVTWGIGFSYFNELPRTVKEAKNDGYVRLPDSSLFCGQRYTKDADRAAIVLFDKNGFISGLQTSYNKDMAKDRFFIKQTPPFVDEGDYLTLTAYFVDPDIACNGGRSAQNFTDQGTGTVLLIQNSRDPYGDKIVAPLKESDISNTNFTKGKCFYTMGMHYWYNTSADMDCDDFKPLFLMYNRGKLNSFGWAVLGRFDSPRFEHPTPPVFPSFFDIVPNCLKKFNDLSTMHIFLTKYPQTNFC